MVPSPGSASICPRPPREISFCAHALASPDVLLVPDTTADTRFADNPLVTGGPRIGFYAGAPLVTTDGYVLGTLCVLDVVPRVLSERRLGQLGVLAGQVVSLLELRRHTEALATEVAARTVAEATLRDNRRLLDGVLNHTDGVIYAKDLDGRFLLANPALEQLLGQGEREVLGRSDYDLSPELAADQFRQHDRQIAASGISQLHRGAGAPGRDAARIPLDQIPASGRLRPGVRRRRRVHRCHFALG